MLGWTLVIPGALIMIAIPRLVPKLLPRIFRVQSLSELVSLVLGFVVVAVAAYCIYLAANKTKKFGVRAIGRTAAEATQSDSRPPIVLLRAFEDDHRFLFRSWYRFWSVDEFFGGESLEDAIAELFKNKGPFIAIGRPDEWLPPSGAARSYVGDDWQTIVLDYVDRAQLVVFVLGSTGGLTWEVKEVFARCSSSKILIVCPPIDATELRERWTTFLNAIGTGFSSGLPGTPPDDLLGVTWSAAGEPRLLRQASARDAEGRWRGIAGSFKDAFGPVIASVGLQVKEVPLSQLAICSVPLAVLGFVLPPVGILSLVLAVMGYKRTCNNPELRGSNWAVAGVVISCFDIAIYAVILVAILVESF